MLLSDKPLLSVPYADARRSEVPAGTAATATNWTECTDWDESGVDGYVQLGDGDVELHVWTSVKREGFLPAWPTVQIFVRWRRRARAPLLDPTTGLVTESARACSYYFS